MDWYISPARLPTSRHIDSFLLSNAGVNRNGEPSEVGCAHRVGDTSDAPAEDTVRPGSAATCPASSHSCNGPVEKRVARLTDESCLAGRHQEVSVVIARTARCGPWERLNCQRLPKKGTIRPTPGCMRACQGNSEPPVRPARSAPTGLPHPCIDRPRRTPDADDAY